MTMPENVSFDDDGNPEHYPFAPKEEPDCYECNDAGCTDCAINPADFPARTVRTEPVDLTGGAPF